MKAHQHECGFFRVGFQQDISTVQIPMNYPNTVHSAYKFPHRDYAFLNAFFPGLALAELLFMTFIYRLGWFYGAAGQPFCFSVTFCSKNRRCADVVCAEIFAEFHFSHRVGEPQ